MANRVNWNGEAVKRQFAKLIKNRIKTACVFLHNQVKSDISQSGVLRYHPLTKKGTAAKSQKSVYNFTHSRPGNPPYKQKGTLRRSVGWEVKGLKGRVGVDLGMAVYGKHLELGTRKMAARPFLRPALRKVSPQLRAILTGKIKPGELSVIGGGQYRSGQFGAGARKIGWS